MTSDDVTLIAAGIAATASLVALGFNIWNHRSSETRAALRVILAPVVDELGERIHEVVAMSTMMSKADSEQSRLKWREQAAAAAEKLKRARRRVRYSLWGLDEGLRTLARTPDWISHLSAAPVSAKQLLDASGELAEALDEAVRSAYLTGRPPKQKDVKKADAAADKVRSLRDRIMGTDSSKRR
ncbi:hypothetical protein WI460_14695 [Gemmatimonadota bacterium Y43]|uniref:hypothetical protein n=1 Tax=Gaopeijia maritima TaxID=3119007 RepID=UPI00328C639C